MSNPSFDNIDKWLFEYAEGNLSTSQETQLKQFLSQNPSLEQDLDAWQFAKVESTNVVYPHLDKHIKKPIAWMIPAFVASGILVSGAFGLLSWDSVNAAEVPFADAAHTLGDRAVEMTTSKGESYYSAKKQSESIPSTFNLSGIEFPDFLNMNSMGCGGVIDYSNDFRYRTSYGGNNALLLADGIEENEAEEKRQLDNLSNTELSVSADIEGSSEKSQLETSGSSEGSSRAENKISSTYNSSFSSKAKSFLRKVVRMTENPIALRNSKDIYYHVPGMQTLDVSFGSAGSLLRTRVQSISRMQWTGHSQQQFSNQLSVDSYVKSIRGGIGVQMNHTYYGNGEYQVGQFALTYSPKFAVSKNVVIEPAIRFKMGDKRLYNQKTLPGQAVELERGNVRIVDNEGANSGTQNLWYKDIGLGIVSNTKWFSAGFQIDNLGKHYNNAFNSSDSENRAKNHITATLGTDYVSRTKLFSFSPYLMYQKVENLSEIWGGSIFRYKKVTFGGGYSSLGDYAGSFGIKTNRLMVTYNADYSLSVLSNKRLFSQQLTVRILTNKGRNDQRMLNL
ncbi:MAG: type IX secretion system membrane protein PorP/SprF [Crocinitomicaceae bacterium]